MAELNIILGPATSPADYGGAQVHGAHWRAEETITTTTSSQASSIASKGRQEVFTLSVSGGNVRVAFGVTPSVTASTGALILDGQTRDFGRLGNGDKVAVIDDG